MSRRCLALLGLVLVCGLGLNGLAAQPAAPARDWKAHPAIVEVDTREDVYALGDIHGDYERLITLLLAGKILEKDPGPPEKARWAAGKAVLVCTGDTIDKWNQSLRVLALLRALTADAARAGGRVIVTMGNHEAEFLGREGRSLKTADFVKELKVRGVPVEAVVAGRDALGVGAYLRSLPFAARVNDWFFSHAGNTQGRTLAQLATGLREGVNRKGFRAPVLSDPTSLLEARLRPAPWWEQKGDKSGQGRERLAGNARALGVKHLAMGHQPAEVRFADGSKRKAGELAHGFDGLIFFLDVGMSRGIGYSTGALLHIRPGEARGVFANGTTRSVWTAR